MAFWEGAKEGRQLTWYRVMHPAWVLSEDQRAFWATLEDAWLNALPHYKETTSALDCTPKHHLHAWVGHSSFHLHNNPLRQNSYYYFP